MIRCLTRGSCGLSKEYIYFADATSKQVEVDETEVEIAAFNHASIAITTEAAAACAASDDEYVRMVRAKSGNGPLTASCGEYRQLWDKVYIRARLLYYEDRLVIPRGLREKVLDILHAAHQGIGSMQHRASQMVY